MERYDVEREETPAVHTVDEIGDTEDVLTTDDLVVTGEVITDEGAEDVERGMPPRERMPSGPDLPPEDAEVNAVGSYETWNQSGMGLDAAASRMTGDEWTTGLTGTGFEDDPEVHENR